MRDLNGLAASLLVAPIGSADHEWDVECSFDVKSQNLRLQVGCVQVNEAERCLDRLRVPHAVLGLCESTPSALSTGTPTKIPARCRWVTLGTLPATAV